MCRFLFWVLHCGIWTDAFLFRVVHCGIWTGASWSLRSVEFTMFLTFEQASFMLCINICSETERSSGWLPWPSLETLKLVSSNDRGSHPDDFPFLCTHANTKLHHSGMRRIRSNEYLISNYPTYLNTFWTHFWNTHEPLKTCIHTTLGTNKSFKDVKVQDQGDSLIVDEAIILSMLWLSDSNRGL